MTNGKTLLILGASSELGLALIDAVHSGYDRIVAHYNSSGDQLTALHERLGGKVFPLQADFSSEADTIAFVARVAAEFGAPDDVVHLSAKPIQYEKFPKIGWRDVQRELDISLRTAFCVLSEVVPAMSKRGRGKVVFVLSSCTANAPKYLAGYTSVKFALLGLMKSLATEYAGKGLCFNAVSPSMIETRFVANIPRIAVEQNAKNSPRGRNATVADIVPSIEFLLSGKSDYITGQNLVVSGGSVL